jgi:hypothetical protein
MTNFFIKSLNYFNQQSIPATPHFQYETYVETYLQVGIW